MAAQVITRDEVFLVADEIARTGKVPSANAIYAILKKGGMTTINNFLKEWRQQQVERILKMPDQFEKSAIQLVLQLWKSFCDEYSAEMQATKAANELIVEGALKERDEAFQAIDEERSKLAESEKNKQHEETLRKALEIQFAKLQAESDCKVSNLEKQLTVAKECINAKNLESARLRDLNTVQDRELVHLNGLHGKLKLDFEVLQFALQKRETELEALHRDKIESEIRLQQTIKDLISDNKRVDLKLKKMKCSRSAKDLSQPRCKRDARTQKRRTNTV